MPNFRPGFLNLTLIACAAFASAVASADPATASADPATLPVAPLVETVDTQVYQVEVPTIVGAPYQILSSADGRVYTVSPLSQALIEKLQDLNLRHVPAHLHLFNGEIIEAVELTADEAQAYSAPAPQAHVGNSPIAGPIAEFVTRQNYQPTILNTMDDAHRLFKSLRPLSHTSQCHERAMVWTHDMADTGIRSMKVMMYYTPRFRNEFLHKKSGFFSDTYEIYKWWYHTAPVVYVGNDPIVLDPEFTDHEMSLEDWSHYFLNEEMFPNEHTSNNIKYVPYSNVSDLHLSTQQSRCKIIGNFREYAIPALKNSGPGNGDLTPFLDWERGATGDPYCMMRVYPMYYMQPADIAQLDCDPAQDPDYTRGLTGYGMFHPAIGTRVFDRNNDGRFKSPCVRTTINDFRKGDLEAAYKNASQRDPDPKTGR